MMTNYLIAQDLKSVKYTDGKQSLLGLITSNAGKEAPGVLILPAWKGIDNEAKQAAINLEKEGYIAFIADIYGEGNYPADNAAASKLSSEYKSDFTAYQNRIKLALTELQKNGAKNVAVIGYCFGGTGALESARGGLDVLGVVCIHGGLAKGINRKNNPIHTKVLIEHPANDQSVFTRGL
ncbi:MAG: dienelactone hydrolase family protein [Sphingobacterium sp.]